MADAPFALTVRDLVHQSHKNSADHGFWSDPETAETTPSKLALIHSEVSEALESYRNPESDSLVPVPEAIISKLLGNWFATEGSEEWERRNEAADEMLALYSKWEKKPKGLDIEMADIVIRVADFCGKHGIDLDAAVQRKHAYNVTRPMRHNRIV